MKILAVSDEVSLGLETLIATKPEKYGGLDLIVSCGDLDSEYLEYLVDGLNRDLFFVTGNHPLENNGDIFEPRSSKTIKYIAGYADLHGRVEVYKNYLITGFGGSMWYNGKKNQYTEEAMAKVVRSVEHSIKWHQLQDTLLGRQKKEIIVISHAPVVNIHDQPDKPHKGFKCFQKFIEKVSPLLWLHGHIHLVNPYINQISVSGATTVANAFGCKIIEINSKEIQILSHCYQ